MTDEDLGRPLAPCSLNFTLAEITVIGVSGETIVIPATSQESSEEIFDTHSPTEVQEVRLAKTPYNPDPQPMTIDTHNVRTWVDSPHASVESEIADQLLPYHGNIAAASFNQDRAAIRAIMDARRRTSVEPTLILPQDLAGRSQIEPTKPTDNAIEEFRPSHLAENFHQGPGCHMDLAVGSTSTMIDSVCSQAASESASLIDIDIEFSK